MTSGSLSNVIRNAISLFRRITLSRKSMAASCSKGKRGRMLFDVSSSTAMRRGKSVSRPKKRISCSVLSSRILKSLCSRSVTKLWRRSVTVATRWTKPVVDTIAGVLLCPACVLSSWFCPDGVGFCASGASEGGALQSGRGGAGGGAACCARAQVTETQRSIAHNRKAPDILSVIFIAVIIETLAAQRQLRRAQRWSLGLILVYKTPTLVEVVPGTQSVYLTSDA